MNRTASAGAVVFVSATILLLLSACVDDGTFEEPEEAPKRVAPLRLPRNRLPRQDEEKVVELIDDLRGVDAEYLARIKAEEMLMGLIDKGETGVVDYVVPVLNEPKWDARAAALRILIKHGRTCPEAVAALVQVVCDPAMNAAVRDDAAKALRGWTGLYFGFNPWADPAEAKAAAAKWKVWLDGTGGRIDDVP